MEFKTNFSSIYVSDFSVFLKIGSLKPIDSIAVRVLASHKTNLGSILGIPDGVQVPPEVIPECRVRISPGVNPLKLIN